MLIKIDKANLIQNILKPFESITDSLTLTIGNEYCDAISSSSEKRQTIVLYGKNKSATIDDTSTKLAISLPSIKRLRQLLQYIKSDVVTMEYNKNHLFYEDSSINFKYFLVDENIVQKSPITIDKLNSTVFDFECLLKPESIKSLLSIASVLNSARPTDDSAKIYLYTKGGSLFGVQEDKEVSNIDTAEILVSDTVMSGELTTQISIHMDVFRILFLENYSSISLKINTERGIILLTLEDKDNTLKYITSTRTK